MYQGFAKQQNQEAQIAGVQAWGQVATSVG